MTLHSTLHCCFRRLVGGQPTAVWRAKYGAQNVDPSQGAQAVSLFEAVPDWLLAPFSPCSDQRSWRCDTPSPIYYDREFAVSGG